MVCHNHTPTFLAKSHSVGVASVLWLIQQFKLFPCLKLSDVNEGLISEYSPLSISLCLLWLVILSSYYSHLLPPLAISHSFPRYLAESLVSFVFLSTFPLALLVTRLLLL